MRHATELTVGFFAVFLLMLGAVAAINAAFKPRIELMPEFKDACTKIKGTPVFNSQHWVCLK